MLEGFDQLSGRPPLLCGWARHGSSASKHVLPVLCIWTHCRSERVVKFCARLIGVFLPLIVDNATFNLKADL